MRRRIPVHRFAQIPDAVRLERYRRTPELGPNILFFSGGTAIRELSKQLKEWTYNSCHLITPFDSGGSSALLRDAFAMPSVGDLRNRLCALADEALAGNKEIRELFTCRFPLDEDERTLRAKLEGLRSGRDPLIESIPQPIRNLVATHFRAFCDAMPEDFDLRGASLGNLTLVGAYLMNDRDIDAVSYLYSRLLEVRGTVRCTVNAHLDIRVELEDGTVHEQQHQFTGKESAPISSPIRSIQLRKREEPNVPTQQLISRSTGESITEADLVCFPMGSFYSSVIANLLPAGVGSSVKRARGPRLYIPNTGNDPEVCGESVADTVTTLLSYLRRDAGESTPTSDLLDIVLVDSSRGDYPNGLDIEAIESLGVTVLDMDLVDPNRTDRLCANKLTAALLSLA